MSTHLANIISSLDAPYRPDGIHIDDRSTMKDASVVLRGLLQADAALKTVGYYEVTTRKGKDNPLREELVLSNSVDKPPRVRDLDEKHTVRSEPVVKHCDVMLIVGRLLAEVEDLKLKLAFATREAPAKKKV